MSSSSNEPPTEPGEQSDVSPLPQQELVTVKLRTVLITTHTAEATAVSSTMDAAVAILREAEKQLKFPVKIGIKVRPFEPGSFEIPLELQVLAATGLAYLTDGAPYLDQVLKVFTDFISLKKLLKGDTPPESAKSGPFSIDGNTWNFNNSAVTMNFNVGLGKAVGRAAEEVQKDANIEAIEFLKGADHEKLVEVERKDLRYLQRPEKLNAKPQFKQKKVKKAQLVVVKPVLNNSNDKWTLSYLGNQIWAALEDDEFREKVVNREELFGAKDVLVADLRIQQELDPVRNVYEDKEYTIVKVRDVLAPPPQKEFGFMNDKAPVKKQAKKKVGRKAVSPKKKTPKKKGGKKKGDK